MSQASNGLIECVFTECASKECPDSLELGQEPCSKTGWPRQQAPVWYSSYQVTAWYLGYYQASQPSRSLILSREAPS